MVTTNMRQKLKSLKGTFFSIPTLSHRSLLVNAYLHTMISMYMMSSLEPGRKFSAANLTDHSQYVLIPGFFNIPSRAGPGSSTRPAGLSSCTGGITEDGRGRRRATCGR
jgi:hypothetical protein